MLETMYKKILMYKKMPKLLMTHQLLIDDPYLTY
jgi:hypothetical protein